MDKAPGLIPSIVYTCKLKLGDECFVILVLGGAGGRRIRGSKSPLVTKPAQAIRDPVAPPSTELR